MATQPLTAMATPRAPVKTDGGRTGRYYTLEDGTQLPSVTSVVGIIAKPQLVPWATKLEREAALQAAGDLWQTVLDNPKLALGERPISRLGFVESLKRRLGQQKASDKASGIARDFGKTAHAYVEWYSKKLVSERQGTRFIEAGPRLDTEELRYAGMSWLNWQRDQHFTPTLVEEVVYSKAGRYAGTLDSLGEVDLPDGRRVVAVCDWKTSSGIYGEARMQVSAYAAACREMRLADGEIWGCIVRLPKVLKDTLEVVWISPGMLAYEYAGFAAARALWAWQNEKPEDTF